MVLSSGYTTESLEKSKNEFYLHVLDLQQAITNELLRIDPNIKITEDNWQRNDFLGQPGGGGRTRAFEGSVFENAGVNVSQVFGSIDPSFAKTLGAAESTMWASGISLIIHPLNPKVPTVHANFRFICTGQKIWFGGGADLTPYYPHTEDFRYFHGVWKDTLASYNCYEQMKKNCDEYFVNYHRNNEMRGIGGFFFDHYNSNDLNADMIFVKEISKSFIRSYFPIVDKRKDELFSPDDVDFQLHRHGRYVEFNLLHDRGTMFGLKTNGRTDSILISLPKRCNFTYQYQPKANSPHQEMLQYYYPKEWA